MIYHFNNYTLKNVLFLILRSLKTRNEINLPLIKKIFLSGTVSCLLLIQGCLHVNNGDLHFDETPPDINYLPILLPFIFGGNGSGIPITDSISLTAAHVAKYDYSNVIAYHPTCDVALIEENNQDRNKMRLGMIHSGEALTNHGYDISGKVVKGEGVYIMDVIIETYPECNYSLNTAPQISGMSGGPVINSSGELVGVIHGIGYEPPILLEKGEAVHLERYSYFVSINFIRDWLETELEALEE
ncbi:MULTISPECIES: trypsin-like peptidase domain-containing protein [Vibrio]|uniref:trypsin-like peptidase domain-containing protein n=1 Tax=Vibrio TaxID=662 RepID=UPI000C83DE2F|nr:MULTISPECIES: trypsin-like peptidase domain-containing protein [unclassified Vibrio]PMI18514.1 hypothetical protein BCU50_21475 [Vibrio sp. 10N.286.46.E10]PTO94809.1 hypothetical protein CWO17_24115 [Vibrio sp. 10N.286.45.A3]PTQ18625.1 hypothetical protein CWO24_23660 [Vibrio sp. 10N.286.46.E10]TKE74972.1 trypsin-like peptidase domain-containing protein [Vibrio sp. F12]TKE75495.1 trypsin-like peptidase domain-containing protein [Vibrio sp. F12]